MAQRRLTSTGRRLLGMVALFAILTYLHIFSSHSTSGGSALDTGSTASASNNGPSNPATLLRVVKRSDMDYYDEQSGGSSSGGYESFLRHSGGGGSPDAGDDRALQSDDGEEGKDAEQQTRIWDACKTRGANLVKLFGKKSVPDSEKSTFKKYDDLAKHGWTVKEEIVDPTAQDLTLKNPLDKIQIPYGKATVDAKLWHSLEYEHSKETKGGGKKVYPATKAKYLMTHNAAHGLIVSVSLHAPATTELGKKLPKEQIMPLKFSSDIIYLAWERQCQLAKVPPSSLKYYLGPNVVNTETREAVRKVVGGFLAKKLPSWPGMELNEKTHPEQIAGLLGTPVGTALGRLLTQRKETMGVDRRVVSIRLWKEEPNDDKYFEEHGSLLYMLYELSDPPKQSGGASMPAGLLSKKPIAVVGGQKPDVSADPASFKGKSKAGAVEAKLQGTLQSSKGKAGPAAGKGSGSAGASKAGPQRGPRSLRESRSRRRSDESHISSRQPHHTVSNETTDDATLSTGATQGRHFARTEPSSSGGKSFGKAVSAPASSSSGGKSIGKTVSAPGTSPNSRQCTERSLSQSSGYREPGKNGDGYSFHERQAFQAGHHWLSLLGSDSMSRDDVAEVPADGGPVDYGYKIDTKWELPHYEGLADIAPAFYDAQGKPDVTWKARRWYHRYGHFEPGDSKKRPLRVLNGVFENVYSPERGIIVYWKHTEPLQLKGADQGNKGNPLLGQADGKQVAEHKLTPLRLPDFWMFDWIRVCKEARRPVAGLKHIIMPDITETQTLTLLTDMGCGSTLGVSVAKLIVQRHELFGAKRSLTGAKVWWTPPAPGAKEDDEGSVSILWTLDDPPADLIRMQRAALAAGGGGLPQSSSGKKPT